MPPIKQNLISSILNFVYELPHKFLNNLSLKIFGNKEKKENKKNGLGLRLVSSLFSRNYFLSTAVKTYEKPGTKFS